VADPSKEILKHDAFEVLKDSISQMPSLNADFLAKNFDNRDKLSGAFKDSFSDLMQNSLCDKNDIFNISLLPMDCNEFAFQWATHVRNDGLME